MIDPNRLARSVHLSCERTPSAFIVSGGEASHLVPLDASECGCPDALYRPTVICSHRLRVMLALGDADVLLALRDLVPMPKPQRHRVGIAADHREISARSEARS